MGAMECPACSCTDCVNAGLAEWCSALKTHAESFEVHLSAEERELLALMKANRAPRVEGETPKRRWNQ